MITRAQLLELGLGADAIDHRLTVGRLRRVFRGVYFTGYGPLPDRARELAAVLAYGPHAVASHRSAGALWQLIAPLPQAPIEITIPRGCGEGQAGIRLHRVRELQPNEVRQLSVIPLTSPARTLLDLAAALPVRQLERALAEAHARRLVTHSHLLHLLNHHRGRAGTRALRALLDGSAPTLTRSEAEERFLALMRAAGLPQPEVNVLLGNHEIDFLWRRQRLIVEIDGFAFHSSRRAFERDRARDAELEVRGWRVVRFTWRQLTAERERAIATVAALIART